MFYYTVADSPSLGASKDIFSQILIRSNDNANGILQLSTPAVSIREGETLPFIFVNRSAGSYGEVGTIYRHTCECMTLLSGYSAVEFTIYHVKITISESAIIYCYLCLL